MARLKKEAVLLLLMASIATGFCQSLTLSIPLEGAVLCSYTTSVDATTVITFTSTNELAVGQGTTATGSGYQNALVFDNGGIVPSSSGLYTCTVTQNGIEVESVMFQLDGTTRRLVSATITTAQAPVISGNDLNVECFVIVAEFGTNSPTTPEIQWLAPDMTIVPAAGDNILVSTSFPISTLMFRPTLSPQGGIYTCRANFSGLISTDIFQLEFLNQIPPPLVSIIINRAPIVPASANFSLTCNVTLAILEPAMVTVVWQRPGQAGEVINATVPSNGTYLSTIDVTSAMASDAGDYTCTATISSSNVTRDPSNPTSDTVGIAVILLAGPLNVTSISPEPTQVLVQWLPVPGDVIDSYHITISSVVIGCGINSTNEETINGTALNYTAAGLEEMSEVTITIVAENLAGNSTVATILANTTTAPPSGEPQSFNVTSATGTSITLSWERVNCIDRNSVIDGYFLTYALTSDIPRAKRQTMTGGNNVTIQGTSQAARTFTVTGLFPRTSYTFQLAAVSSSGMGRPTATLVASTVGPTATLVASTVVPSVVRLLHRGNIIANNSILSIDDVGTSMVDSLTCITSKQNCCSLSEQELGQWLDPEELEVDDMIFSVDRGPSVLSLNNIGAGENDTGLFQCQVPDSQGVNQTLFVGLYDEFEGTPVLESLNYDITTGYLVARSSGGPAQTVNWTLNGSNVSFDTSQSVIDVSTATYNNFLLLNEQPPSDIIGDYRCQVSNERGSSEVENIRLRGVTISGLEDSYDEGDRVVLNCSTDLMSTRISWEREDRLTLVTTSSQSYIVLRIDRLTAANYSDPLYCRSESSSGFIRKSVVLNVTSESTRDLRGPIIGGVLGGLFLIILILIILFLLCCICCQLRSNKVDNSKYLQNTDEGRYKPTYPETSIPMEENPNTDDRPDITPGYGQLDNSEDSNPKPDLSSSIINAGAMMDDSTFLARDREDAIPVPDFPAHVEQMHIGKNFETEYNQIPRTALEAYEVGVLPHNKTRNRFGNIFPYDGNRVILKALPGVKGSDYINASFIDVYERKKVYIASQGPTPGYVGDFWRMIWENRVPTVLMLARCYEDGKKKCEQYWPEKMENEMKMGDNLCVTLNSSTPYVNFTIRKMSLRNSAEPDIPPVEVTQFHFQAWPDHGVPINAMSLIHFIKQVRKVHPQSNTKPLVVHCSAGVGRTGTLITLDYMLYRIPLKQTLNVFPFVKYLRKQRILMVQTLAQYEFIHDALNEFILCGDTEVQASKMRETYEELQTMEMDESTQTEKTKLEMQFELLDEVSTDVPTTKYVHAKAPCNIDKNRFSKRIPNYFTRVRLRPTGQEGSDYINASFIDGYRKQQAFICTQGCLENTVDDIWRMIFEYRCKCIVMLCDLEENFNEQCEQYWPDDTYSPVKYGKLTVVKTTEETYQGYIVRKFEVTGTLPKSLSTGTDNLSPSFVVTQFQYLGWEENKVPDNTSTILEIIEKVKKVQISTGNKSMVIMCNDGVGRSGAFMGIYTQLERLNAEGNMDLFQYIKAVRLERAGLLLHKDQYDFCHKVLADYVDNFETYSNFK